MPKEPKECLFAKKKDFLIPCWMVRLYTNIIALLMVSFAICIVMESAIS